MGPNASAESHSIVVSVFLQLQQLWTKILAIDSFSFNKIFKINQIRQVAECTTGDMYAILSQNVLSKSTTFPEPHQLSQRILIPKVFKQSESRTVRDSETLLEKSMVLRVLEEASAFGTQQW